MRVFQVVDAVILRYRVDRFTSNCAAISCTQLRQTACEILAGQSLERACPRLQTHGLIASSPFLQPYWVGNRARGRSPSLSAWNPELQCVGCGRAASFRVHRVKRAHAYGLEPKCSFRWHAIEVSGERISTRLHVEFLRCWSPVVLQVHRHGEGCSNGKGQIKCFPSCIANLGALKFKQPGLSSRIYKNQRNSSRILLFPAASHDSQIQE
jgi:hypothetical protein